MRIRTSLLLVPLIAAIPLSLAARADPPASQPAATAPAPPVLSTPVTPPTSDDQFLTEAQLVQAYRAGQFPMIIHEVFRIQTNTDAAAHANLFNLLVLKAESQLQTKNIPESIESFNEAAKLAPDDDRKAIMQATAMLLRQQFEYRYLSKTTDEDGMPLPRLRKLSNKPVGIDLLDLSKRIIALRALCSDELAKAAQMLTVRYASIPALEPLFKVIDEVSIAERAAAGTQTETKKLQLKTAQLAGRLISGVIADDTRQAEMFKRQAADMIQDPNAMANNRGGGRYGNGNIANSAPMRLRGLSDAEATQLQGMIAMTLQVPAQTKKLVARLHLDANFYDVIDAAAVTLNKLAQGILDNTPVYGYR